MPKKISKEEIESLIQDIEYTQNGLLVIAVATIKNTNNFKVLAYSGTIDSDNFDLEKGKEVAYNNVLNKIWELEGYYRVKTEAGNLQK